VPEQTIRMVNDHFKNIEVLRKEHESAQAFELAFAELYGLEYNYFAMWNEKITNLKPEQLQESAKKLLFPEKLQIIITGNKDKISNLDISELIQ
jgi:predicted Zn-dependent peptidase